MQAITFIRIIVPAYFRAPVECQIAIFRLLSENYPHRVRPSLTGRHENRRAWSGAENSVESGHRPSSGFTSGLCLCGPYGGGARNTRPERGILAPGFRRVFGPRCQGRSEKLPLAAAMQRRSKEACHDRFYCRHPSCVCINHF